MAGETNKTTEVTIDPKKAAQARVETGVSTDRSTSFDAGTRSAEGHTTEGASVQFAPGNKTLETEADLNAHIDASLGEGELGADGGAGVPDSSGGDDAGAGDGSKAEGEDAALPDFDAGNPEVLAQYDAKFFKAGDDGKMVLNEEALGAEYWADFHANNGDVTKASIKPGTRAFLKERFGLTDPFIDTVSRGLVAEQAGREEKFFADRGGKQQYGAAMDFLRANYTDAQKARYKALQDNAHKDPEAFNEAADALMQRWHRSRRPGVGKGGATQQAQPGARPAGRPSSPQRDATSGGTTQQQNAGGQRQAQGETFPDQQAYAVAFQEAYKSKDPKKIEEVRAKGRRSGFVK